MANQPRGGTDDMLRTAVVLFESDNPNVCEIVFEVEDVLDVRAAPAVDRLVWIARHGQIRICD